MSTRLIQDLHAGISRRDWSAVEMAANSLRDEIEETRRILAGTGISSLPNDYPLPRLAMEAKKDGGQEVEAVAKRIYEAMRVAAHAHEPDRKTPEWVERGNSLMQEEARRVARSIASRPLITKAEQDVIALVIAAREILDSGYPDDPEDNPLSIALEEFESRVPYTSDVEAGICAAIAAAKEGSGQ